MKESAADDYMIITHILAHSTHSAGVFTGETGGSPSPRNLNSVIIKVIIKAVELSMNESSKIE